MSRAGKAGRRPNTGALHAELRGTAEARDRELGGVLEGPPRGHRVLRHGRRRVRLAYDRQGLLTRMFRVEAATQARPRKKLGHLFELCSLGTGLPTLAVPGAMSGFIFIPKTAYPFTGVRREVATLRALEGRIEWANGWDDTSVPIRACTLHDFVVLSARVLLGLQEKLTD